MKLFTLELAWVEVDRAGHDFGKIDFIKTYRIGIDRVLTNLGGIWSS